MVLMKKRSPAEGCSAERVIDSQRRRGLFCAEKDKAMSILEKYGDLAYALLRIVTGFMFSCHGGQKILGLLDGIQPPVGSQLWIGGLIELVGGLTIMVGLATRTAAFLCSGEMAVAYFQFHWKFQLGAAFFPIVNKGELAVLYCFIFLFIATRGGGRWSLDSSIMPKGKERHLS
jgi:putative oxidoreductase